MLRLLLASALSLPAGSAAAIAGRQPAPMRPGLSTAGAATAAQPGLAAAGAGTAAQLGRAAAGAGTAPQPGRATAGVATAAQPGLATAGAGSDMSYTAPIAGPLRVLRPFQPPPTPYSAGHRGVDLATPLRAEVLAAGAGRVTFAGTVAGRGVVVIAHPDGIRTEYEPVRAVVAAGQAVARGELIGRVAGQHAAWPPGRCLHWGARRGEVYLDPLLLLQPLGPVRLLPWPR